MEPQHGSDAGTESLGTERIAAFSDGVIAIIIREGGLFFLGPTGTRTECFGRRHIPTRAVPATR
jgi:hypothetical protein